MTRQHRLWQLREQWKKERDPWILRTAIRHCRGHNLPSWLADALLAHLNDTLQTPAEKKAREENYNSTLVIDTIRDAYHSGAGYSSFYLEDGEDPGARHFHAACERLGLNYNYERVRKTWQRHKPPTREEYLAQKRT